MKSQQFGTQHVTIRQVNRGLFPAINVKIRHGLEAVTPAQWEELRADTEAKPDGTIFGRTYCEEQYEKDAESFGWNSACEQAFEMAEQDAHALFGPHVRCSLDGRSGGWFVVEGLPDVETWGDLSGEDGGDPMDLPNLKDTVVGGALRKDGTRLPDDASILERWAFFEEVCDAYVRDVPYLYASGLALNNWPREVEEARAEAQDIAVTAARDLARDAMRAALELIAERYVFNLKDAAGNAARAALRLERNSCGLIEAEWRASVDRGLAAWMEESKRDPR